MKQRISSSESLHQMFERNISVRTIAEPLVSFDVTTPALKVRNLMDQKDYDSIGIRENGIVYGYGIREHLDTGILGDYLRSFSDDLLLSEDAMLTNTLESLRHQPFLFVIILGTVGGIVTRGDLQKVPVRMWLFGLISLIEMNFLRIIRKYYPNNSWESLISEGRLTKARSLLEERKRRNQAIDLADCLQFEDKREIVLKNNRLTKGLGFTSKNSGQGILKELERLRDNLAHSQDILNEPWPQIVDLTQGAETILSHSETL